MQNAMFSGLFGALTAEHRLNGITNNLANINTTGYKRDVQAFTDTMVLFAHDQVREPSVSIRSEPLLPEPNLMARSRIAVSATDQSQGALKGTGNPLDVAITGDGFFKVRTTQGEFYTRNGHFRINAEGTLITDQGHPVLGQGAEIAIPGSAGNLIISEDGRIFADGDEVGQLQLVNVENLSALEKMGSNLFKARDGVEVGEQDADFNNSVIVQGFLEQPNVDVVYEMVNMIETQRQFEAYQKIMQTSDAIDREATTKIGRGK